MRAGALALLVLLCSCVDTSRAHAGPAARGAAVEALETCRKVCPVDTRAMAVATYVIDLGKSVWTCGCLDVERIRP